MSENTIIPEVESFIFNHTMLRVKSLDDSLTFYQNALGFFPVYRRDFADDAFTIVYMIRKSDVEIPENDAERYGWVLSQQGVLELTWNHGTENSDDFKYHNGNSTPLGFGHLCVVVPDITSACNYFDSLHIPFKKRLTDGRMRDVVFIMDPDGYWIEILERPIAPL